MCRCGDEDCAAGDSGDGAVCDDVASGLDGVGDVLARKASGPLRSR